MLLRGRARALIGQPGDDDRLLDVVGPLPRLCLHLVPGRPLQRFPDPFRQAIRQGDEDFTNIVAWSVFALVEAEELGITQANVDQVASASASAAVRRFLGVDGTTGQSLGAAGPHYAREIVRAVGNYGELFDRHLGSATPLGLERGLNNLWIRGGLMYAPPAR